MTLTATDFATHAALGITAAMLERTQVRRVDDREAREMLSSKHNGDLSGILYPYPNPITGHPSTYRLRRDHPEMENGKPKDKYISAWGDRKHICFPPNCMPLLADVTVTVIVVESEKAVFSATCAAERLGRTVLVVATGGCWGWRGVIGKAVDANGARVDEKGPLPDLDLITWTGRTVEIAFDANAATNTKVQGARRALAKELTKRGAVVRILDIPEEPGINGPDDYIGRHGAEAFFALVDNAGTAGAETGFPLTEAGDAECLADLYQDRLRYDHHRGRWLVSDEASGIWIPDPVERLTQMTVATMRLRQRQANAIENVDQRKAAWVWAIKGEGRGRINNTLALARSVPPIADAGLDWDQNPFLLGAQNGVIDLPDKRFRKALPTDRVTMRVRVAYDATATCPLWLQTLGGIFAPTDLLTKEESRLQIDFMQRAIGYSITGDCREECCFFAWGGGANGKGTLMNTLGWLFGDYTDDMPYSTLERSVHGGGIPNDVAKLEGKRFITCSEVNEFTINEARLKALTGRDPMTARFLNREFFTFIPVGKIWIATNNKPKIEGTDDGIWRRICLIPFLQKFEGANVNKKLKDQLREELPGILNWVIEGARLWLEKGLDPPESVKAATAAYRQETNPITPFIEACCVRGANLRMQAALAFRDYEKFCAALGLETWGRLSDKAFHKAMRLVFQVKEDRQTFYLGVGLRAAGPTDTKEGDG